MAKTKTFTLGDTVRDVVTGFEGCMVVRAVWLHGCARVGIEPTTLDKDERPATEVYWFDEPRIEIVSRKDVPNTTGEKRPGGPQRDPQR